MTWWPVAFALIAASLLPIQAAMNGAINRALHQPPLVVMCSLGGSLVTMLTVVVIGRRFVLPSAAAVAQAPFWAWGAGVCGAIYLLSQPVVLPRIGAAAFTGLAVTAQIVCAVTLDHFGLLGLPQHDASPLRVLGAALMIAGIVLVARN
jgi:transporter family-2 protein